MADTPVFSSAAAVAPTVRGKAAGSPETGAKALRANAKIATPASSQHAIKAKRKQSTLKGFFLGKPLAETSASRTAKPQMIAADPSLKGPAGSEIMAANTKTNPGVTPNAIDLSAVTPTHGVSSSCAGRASTDTLEKRRPSVDVATQGDEKVDDSVVSVTESATGDLTDISTTLMGRTSNGKEEITDAAQASERIEAEEPTSTTLISKKIAEMRARKAKRRALEATKSVDDTTMCASVAKRSRTGDMHANTRAAMVNEEMEDSVDEAVGSEPMVGEAVVDLSMADESVVDKPVAAPKRKAAASIGTENSVVKRGKHRGPALNAVLEADMPALKALLLNAGSTGVESLCKTFLEKRSHISKLQLKKKIAEASLSAQIAVKEKRAGSKKAVWHLRDSDSAKESSSFVAGESAASIACDVREPEVHQAPDVGKSVTNTAQSTSALSTEVDPRAGKYSALLRCLIDRAGDIRLETFCSAEDCLSKAGMMTAEGVAGSAALNDKVGELAFHPRLPELLCRVKSNVSGTPATIGATSTRGTEFSAEEDSLLAILVQGSCEALPALTSRCASVLGMTEIISSSSNVDSFAHLSDKIQLLSRRTCYGVKAKNAVVSHDVSLDAHWRWEVCDVMLLPEDVAKPLAQCRKERKRLGNYIAAVEKLVNMLHALSKEMKPSAREAAVARVSKQEERVMGYARAEETARRNEQVKIERASAVAVKKAEKEAEREAKRLAKQKEKEEKQRAKRVALEAEAAKKKPKYNLFMFGVAKKKATPAAASAGAALASPSTNGTVNHTTTPLASASNTLDGTAVSACSALRNEHNSVVTQRALALEAALAKGKESFVLSYLKTEHLKRISRRRCEHRGAAMRRATAASSAAASAAEVEVVAQPTATAAATTAVRSAAVVFGQESDIEAINRARDLTAASFARKKLLQFHEDHRPAFFGTFRKKSTTITGRAPLALDAEAQASAQRDYEVDSEEEWESEPEDAEGCESGDDEDEGDENDRELDYKDGWLMEDDVVEFEPGTTGADPELKKLQGLKLASCGQGSEPVVIVGLMFGPEDEGSQPAEVDRIHCINRANSIYNSTKEFSVLQKYRVERLDTGVETVASSPLALAPPTVDDIIAECEGRPNARELAEAAAAEAEAKAKIHAAKAAKAAERAVAKEAAKLRRTVTEEQLPRLLRLIEGSLLAKPKIVEAFLEGEAKRTGGAVPAKVQVMNRFAEVAPIKSKPISGKGKARWRVKPELLRAHGIEVFNDDSANAVPTASLKSEVCSEPASPAQKATNASPAQKNTLDKFVKRSPTRPEPTLAQTTDADQTDPVAIVGFPAVKPSIPPLESN